MEVYRCCCDWEIKLYKKGILFNKGFGNGTNTFNYEKGVKYIHFFYFAESMYQYRKNKNDDYTKNYVQYDIPADVLSKYMGYGYYEAIIPGYYVPVPEFAIPRDEFKLEYVKEVFHGETEKYARTTEWEAYKKALSKEYLADYETGSFSPGYNEDSIQAVPFTKILGLKKNI